MTITILLASLLVSQNPPTASELLDKIDKNLTFDARRTHLMMTVEGRRTRTFEMIAYARGQDDTAMEYLAPARDKGTKMLKVKDELWIYLPGVDRIQKISGHMLREGMMGSDVSYEDLMASREMRSRYDATVAGEGVVDGRACWKLEMQGKDAAVTYPKRVSFVDKETYIPVQQELYALSGLLLKTWTMSEVKVFPGGRRYPTRMKVEDHIKKDSVTKIEFKEMEFGVEFPKEIFSNRWLERR